MFFNIAVAFLVSLGIALLLILGVKVVYSRYYPNALHILVLVLVVVGSTVAGTVAITSGKAFKYIVSLEDGTEKIAGQIGVLQNKYGQQNRCGVPAYAMAGDYLRDTAQIAKSRLGKTRNISVVVMMVMNSLLALFLFNAGRKTHSVESCSSDAESLDDYDVSSSLDDLDLV